MNKIDLPYHLIFPTIISILILIIILKNYQKLYKSKKWFCVSLTVFFDVYIFIVGGAAYTDISAKLTLQKFDLNGNGMFNGDEITPELKIAMNKVISETGRNFSMITGLFFLE